MSTYEVIRDGHRYEVRDAHGLLVASGSGDVTDERIARRITEAAYALDVDARVPRQRTPVTTPVTTPAAARSATTE
jgi:hypothetical protein